MNEASMIMESDLRQLGLEYIAEYKFHPDRKWRFDYVLQRNGNLSATSKTAIEIEGAVWTQGRHTRGSGYTKDLEKYREAAVLGWRVLRFSTQEVLDGTARAFIKEHCL